MLRPCKNCQRNFRSGKYRRHYCSGTCKIEAKRKWMRAYMKTYRPKGKTVKNDKIEQFVVLKNLLEDMINEATPKTGEIQIEKKAFEYGETVARNQIEESVNLYNTLFGKRYSILDSKRIETDAEKDERFVEENVLD